MYKNILIPVVLDGSRNADAAFAAARALADDDARLTLLHVIETVPLYVADFIPAEYMSEARVKIARQLDEMARELPNCQAAMTDGRAGPMHGHVVWYTVDRHVSFNEHT